MRRTVLLVAAMALALSLGVGAALAADQIIRCQSAPCYGSGNDDLIYERPANGAYDKIIMKGGHDLVRAQAYTNDTDVVLGGTGYDKINVADGDRRDTASGGRGGDWCIVDSRAEVGGGCSRVSVQ